MNDGYANFMASWRENTLSRAHQYSVVKLGYKSFQRSVHFVMPKSSVIMVDMELKFKSLPHVDTIPMVGWSYPTAQTFSWMGYDARIQNILTNGKDGKIGTNGRNGTH